MTTTDLAITPGGRVGDASPLGTKGPRKLTDYTREIAHALMRAGHDRSSAIAIARAAQARWARGGGHVRPQVRAAAAASTAAQHALDHVKTGRRGHRLAEEQAEDTELGFWNEALHPRLHGKFARKGSGGEAGKVAKAATKGYSMRHERYGRTVHSKTTVMHDGHPIAVLTPRADGGYVRTGMTGGRSNHPSWAMAAAHAISTHKLSQAGPGTSHAAEHAVSTVRQGRTAKKRGDLRIVTPRGSRTKKSVPSKVVRQQRKRAKRYAAEAEKQRELARRIVASQGLGRGRLKTPHRGGGSVTVNDYKGNAFRGLLSGSGFSSFSEADQAKYDLALAEALERDIDLADIDLAPRWKHGWIPLNAEAAAIKARLGDHAGPVRNVGHTDLGHRGGAGMSRYELERHYDAHVRAADALLLKHAKTHDTSRNGVAGTTDEHGNITWSKERDAIHQQIVQDVFAKRSQGVPTDRHVLFLGGAPGAGKSSILRKDGAVPGYRDGQSIVINPDDFKTELAARGLVPDLPGLTPMERTAFVHEESSRMANMLAALARRNGHNVTMDITMSSGKSTQRKLDEFHHAGYSSQAAFVDIPHAMSQKSVVQRHRSGTIAHWKGDGTTLDGKKARPEQVQLGERLVPSSHVSGGVSSKGRSSSYRDAFEEIKHNFDEYRVFDNNNYAGKQIEEKKLKGGKRAKRKPQANLKKWTDYAEAV